MKRREWVFEAMTLMVLSLVVFMLFLLAIFMPVNAQDNPITVCRDTTYPTLRFQFRNIPATWFTYDSGVTWGYWAEGIQYADGVLTADALTVDTDGYAAGTVTLLDYDNGLTWVGDETTAPCDVPNTPVPAVEQVQVVAQVASIGRTCTIKYPQIILVCNG